ncbi:hypothetical protein SKZ59_21790 [Janthinobacterium sp. GMG2]|uniref:hypothetical protein n=1 Tax=Janthinobacterium sp. GMG2 TaxID=3096606 RepID=UPI0029F4826F|nr:hypothetical protein [Janthinobacterium sp. GMG2]MDX8124413.1 hypothetical protein [Janthinobacterium sp. GMG2]
MIRIPQQVRENICVEDDGKLRLDLSNSRTAGYFLHEWLHYVHNLSTINGIYAFASMVNMWANFRNKIDNVGKSSASKKLTDYALSSVQRTHLYRMGARRQRDNPDASVVSGACKVIGASITTSQLAVALLGHPPEYSTIIHCELELDHGRCVRAEIGVVEIIEGIANMLEERFLMLHGELPDKQKVAPYRLVLGLARHVIPEIANDQVIACAITSLQCDDPPLALWELFHALKTVAADRRFTAIERLSLRRLEEYRALIEQVFVQTEQLFPLAEPMGDEVKRLVANMREKFELRRTAPFFELTMLDCIKKEPPAVRATTLQRIIADFSCPRIELEEIGRDVQGLNDVVNFGNSATINSDIEFGQQKLHAALHFMGLHLSEDGFVETVALQASPARRCCPFYNSCAYDSRNTNPEVCLERPWEWLNVPMDPLTACWYRAGVRATRPPCE